MRSQQVQQQVTLISTYLHGNSVSSNMIASICVLSISLDVKTPVGCIIALFPVQLTVRNVSAGMFFETRTQCVLFVFP